MNKKIEVMDADRAISILSNLKLLSTDKIVEILGTWYSGVDKDFYSAVGLAISTLKAKYKDDETDCVACMKGAPYPFCCRDDCQTYEFCKECSYEYKTSRCPILSD